MAKYPSDSETRLRYDATLDDAVKRGILAPAEASRHYSEDLLELYNDWESELGSLLALEFLEEMRGRHFDLESALRKSAYRAFQLGYYFGAMPDDDDA